MTSTPLNQIDPRSRPTRALMWSVSLSIMFLIIYGSCNWITSLRSDVGVMQFAWEKRIPLVPWMIVPHMSIDLFFVAAPFVCRTRRELRMLGTRLAAATLIAGVCFLLFPLRLAEARPNMPGIFGAMYTVLTTGDKPFNMYPSLHVTYLLILWPHYGRHLHWVWRGLLHAWFGLVLVSGLFVYQHHFIDMVGGAILAVTCLYVVPNDGFERDGATGEFRPRLDIALRYALGGAAFLEVAWITGWRGFIAGWIGVSLVIMACAYAFAGPAVYRKSGGRVPVATRLMLAPHMLGLYVARTYWWNRASAPCHWIDERVILGRVLTNREAAEFCKDIAPAAVLDLTAEHAAPAALLKHTRYANIPVLDLTAPSIGQLEECMSFIEAHARHGPVYVYCGLGYSRSAAAAAAYLLHSGRAVSVDEAREIIRARRPEINFKPEMRAVLGRFQAATTSHAADRKVQILKLPKQQT
jgi:protein-tyrosine phosphatase/membrane-associated phospholipid phosphatase